MQNTCYIHTFGTSPTCFSACAPPSRRTTGPVTWKTNYCYNIIIYGFNSVVYMSRKYILVYYKKTKYYSHVFPSVYKIQGPGSSVGIATELWAGRSGTESRWGRDFPPVQTGPGAHPASCTMGTGSFPGVKCGRDVLLTTHPFLVPRSWKRRAISLPTLWATPGL